MQRQNELVQTDEISVVPEGRYWTVKDYRAGTERAANDNSEPQEADNDVPYTNDNVPAGHTAESWSALLDDDIPF